MDTYILRMSQKEYDALTTGLRIAINELSRRGLEGDDILEILDTAMTAVSRSKIVPPDRPKVGEVLSKLVASKDLSQIGYDLIKETYKEK